MKKLSTIHRQQAEDLRITGDIQVYEEEGKEEHARFL
jgi:hypothetical protein